VPIRAPVIHTHPCTYTFMTTDGPR
jgi:hypothetical protein